MNLNKVFSHLSPVIASCKEKDVFRAATFNWEALSQQIANCLQVENVKISSTHKEWKEEELSSLELQKYFTIPIQLSPLTEKAFLLISKSDVNKLVGTIIASGGKEKKFSSEILQEGFFHYLLAEALDMAQRDPFFSPFSLRIEEADEPSSSFFSKEIQISIYKKNFFAKAAISQELQQQWLEYIRQNVEACASWNFSFPSSVQFTTLDLEKQKLQSLEKGDFILLNTHTFNPEIFSGSATLLVGNQPLFTLSIEEGKAAIVEVKELVEHEEISFQPLSIESDSFPLLLQSLLEKNVGDLIQTPEITSSVLLKMGKKKIAKGELVYVGKHLAVCVESTYKV